MISARPFKPAWWLRGAHRQTLWAALVRRRAVPSLRPERLELDDGDFLDLAWAGSDSGPLVVLLHGLEGSVRSKYAASLLQQIAQSGWGGVLMHFRGCSGPANRLDRSYHSGDTDDLSYLLDVLTARFPSRQIMAVGFSLGGNVLLKYLGERGPKAKLSAGAAVSVPFELDAGATRLNQGFSRLYQRHLIASMKRKLRRKFSARCAPIALDKLNQWTTFWAFDNEVTAPLHGFRHVEHYYESSSCRKFLGTIATPTLVLHARDDPFLTQNAIPLGTELSASVRLELSEHGGHVGFVAGGSPLKARYWLDERLMAWFKQHSEATKR